MLSTVARIIAASVVVLASCSGLQPAITVTPAGSLQHGVVFYLHDVFREHPSEFNVTDVTVLEKQPDDSLVEVWSVQGAQPLRAITYGMKYPGLRESQRPLPLKRG